MGGAPAPATQSIWLEPPTPYVSNALGFVKAGSTALAAPVGVASIVVSWAAMGRASDDEQAWPEVMTYVSVVTAALFVPLGLLGMFDVLINLP